MTTRSRNRRGQALVEFALLLPFLLLLLLGVIEFGRAWNVKQVLTNASREGARYAVVYDVAITQTGVVDSVKRILATAGLDTAQAVTTVTLPDGFHQPTGRTTSVVVTHDYRFVVLHRLVTLLTSSNGVMTLRSTSRMRNE